MLSAWHNQNTLSLLGGFTDLGAISNTAVHEKKSNTCQKDTDLNVHGGV